MTIEQAVLLYATIFSILLVPLVWLLLKRRAAKKAAKAKRPGNDRDAAAQASVQPIEWRALCNFRPQALLSGEMWLQTFIAAFVALCLGVIIVVFVFPLGAVWAASAAFLAVIVIVALIFTLLGEWGR